MGFIFTISLLFMLYTYAGYPLVLLVWSRISPRRVKRSKQEQAPSVSVIIAARNEEENIGKRIENLFSLDYPPESMEIIIVSDGSTDATDDIVGSYASPGTGAREGRAVPGLRLISHEANRGKPAALNAGLEAASGEFIVFTDSRQLFEPDAVTELISNFSDPAVGTVSGELVFREDSESRIKVEMGLYWDLEKWIRRRESEIHSAAGATGAIYAARRELVDPLPEEAVLDDVLVPMRAVLKGYRNLFDRRAVAWDVVSKDLSQEKKRKIRTLFGNYQLLQIMPELMSPVRNPIFFQFICHKFFRLLVPFFFVMMMLAALFAGGALHRVFFLLVLIFLLLPLLESRVSSIPVLGKLSSISRTFTSLNYFAFLGFLRFVRPGERNIWQ